MTVHRRLHPRLGALVLVLVLVSASAMSACSASHQTVTQQIKTASPSASSSTEAQFEARDASALAAPPTRPTVPAIENHSAHSRDGAAAARVAVHDYLLLNQCAACVGHVFHTAADFAQFDPLMTSDLRLSYEQVAASFLLSDLNGHKVRHAKAMDDAYSILEGLMNLTYTPGATGSSPDPAEQTRHAHDVGLAALDPRGMWGDASIGRIQVTEDRGEQKVTIRNSRQTVRGLDSKGKPVNITYTRTESLWMTRDASTWLINYWDGKYNLTA